MNDLPLPRTLRISPRPFLSFAIALSPMLVLAAILHARSGYQPGILFLALIPVVLYALIITIILSQRVTVRPDGIEITTLFRFKRTIRFAKITRTEIQCPAARQRPVRAIIHTTDPEDPVVTISLKPLVREDALWLAALPGLKTEG